MITNRNLAYAPSLPAILERVNRAICFGAQAHSLTGVGHLLVSLATVLQAKFVVRIKPDFSEILALFWLTVADPSERKGAVDKGYRNILAAIENRQNSESARERAIQMSVYQSNLKCVEKMRRRLAAASNVDRNTMLREIAEIETANRHPEAELQFFMQNTTSIALAR